MLRTENWSKSRFTGRLDPHTFSPFPKNPLLASFFVNIGRADTLGSGMRNLYEYSKLYSGSEPILSEGDIFDIKVKLYIGDSNDANDDANDANRDANHEANAANLEANIDESIFLQKLGLRSLISRLNHSVLLPAMLTKVLTNHSITT